MPKVQTKNGDSINLTDRHYKAEGGQAKIYARNGVVYKVYHRAADMIPTAKIDELSGLDRENILRPLDILLDTNSRAVGYTMKFAESRPLLETYPIAWRKRHNVTPDQTLQLVRRIQDGMDFIHGKECLIVDFNSMNVGINSDYNEVYFFDVDSYHTRSFPATAIMDEVKDPLLKGNKFSHESDYYAFAVITHKLFRGVDLRKKFPRHTAMPEDVVPPVYRDWYRAVLLDGKRCKPPADLVATIVIATAPAQVVSGDDLFEIADYAKNLNGDIINYLRLGNNDIFITNKQTYCGSVHVNPADVVGLTDKNNIILGYRHGNQLWIYHRIDSGGNLERADIVSTESMIQYDGRIYIKNGGKLFELRYLENGNKIFSLASAVGNAMESSTQAHDGCFIQNMLGVYFLSVFPKQGEHRQIRLPELCEYTPVGAKYDNGVAVITAVKRGKIDRFIYKFDSGYNPILFERTEVPDADINFVTLDNGTAILYDGEEIILFKAAPNVTAIKRIEASKLGDIRLFKRGTTALFSRNDALYSIKMK